MAVRDVDNVGQCSDGKPSELRATETMAALPTSRLSRRLCPCTRYSIQLERSPPRPDASDFFRMDGFLATKTSMDAPLCHPWSTLGAATIRSVWRPRKGRTLNCRAIMYLLQAS